MILLKSVILLACFGLMHQSEWSYDYEAHWPAQCREGRSQSPIDIESRSAVVDRHGVHLRGPLVFSGYDSVLLDAANNGHTLQWTVRGSAPRLAGGPLRGAYRLLQLHLHWLSEHAIDGMKYPMEIHLVHIKGDLTPSEALLRPDGLAVIGVLCEVQADDAETSFALQQLAPLLPELRNKSAEPLEVGALDLSRLLSPRPQSLYTYHGSLTTPGCEEVVTWIVMDTPLVISDDQFKQISAVNIGGVNNYRSLQRSERVVYRSAARAGAARPARPGALAAVAGLVACLSSSLAASFLRTMCALFSLKKRLFGSTLKDCEKVTN